MPEYSLLLFVSSIGIAHCFFFALYLLVSPSNDKLSSRLLAVFLIALAIRIGKSVVTLITPQYMEVLTAIGVVGMSTIGPTFWYYFRSSFEEEFKVRVPMIYHYLPVVLLVLALPFIYLDENLIYRIYQASLLQLLAYLFLSFAVFSTWTRVAPERSSKKQWGRIFLGSVFLIWLCFFIQLVFETYASYLLATLVATLLLYGLSFWLMTKQRFSLLGKLRSDKREALYPIAVKVRKLLETSKMYLEEAITINKIAVQLGLQPYLISQAINSQLGKSLPELVNDYRIQHAKSLLTESTSLSIKSVAFESGFSTLSAFYHSFRERTKMTPGEFRESFFRDHS